MRKTEKKAIQHQGNFPLYWILLKRKVRWGMFGNKQTIGEIHKDSVRGVGKNSHWSWLRRKWETSGKRGHRSQHWKALQSWSRKKKQDSRWMQDWAPHFLLVSFPFSLLSFLPLSPGIRPSLPSFIFIFFDWIVKIRQ